LLSLSPETIFVNKGARNQKRRCEIVCTVTAAKPAIKFSWENGRAANLKERRTPALGSVQTKKSGFVDALGAAKHH
jgi:hypothetical protein